MESLASHPQKSCMCIGLSLIFIEFLNSEHVLKQILLRFSYRVQDLVVECCENRNKKTKVRTMFKQEQSLVFENLKPLLYVYTTSTSYCLKAKRLSNLKICQAGRPISSETGC